jgi:hypothetical protein
VEKGVVRQFVAMPLGSGYTAEEQLTGTAEHGGVQLLVRPLRAEAYRPRERDFGDVDFAGLVAQESAAQYIPMGIAPGGRMTQEIYRDPQRFEDWDTQHHARCFVHLANTLVWRAITYEQPPTVPPTAEEYTRAGLPWFEYYAADQVALDAGDSLRHIRSVLQMAGEKGDRPLPENERVSPTNVVGLRRGLGKHEVRDGAF